VTRPFRFAATIPDPRLGRAALTERLDELVALGFDTVSVTDHFAAHMGFVAEPLTTLSFVAGINPILTVQTGVLCNDYRHPVLTYRMAANLSQLSEGRLELGMGAGWLAEEYLAAGLSFDPPAIRVARLTEAVAIVKGLFASSPFSFSGDHYSVSDVAVFPPDRMPPTPRLMIGGANRRMLELAGTHADVVGISGSAHVGGSALLEFSPDKLARRVDVALDAAAAAGRPVDQLEFTVPVLVTRVTTTEADAGVFAERLASKYGMDPTDLRANPVALVGTVEHCAEKLMSLRDTFGVTYFHIDPSNLGSSRVDQMQAVIAMVRAWEP
jgi:probable F420-dependent oxidoreductase